MSDHFNGRHHILPANWIYVSNLYHIHEVTLADSFVPYVCLCLTGEQHRKYQDS